MMSLSEAAAKFAKVAIETDIAMQLAVEKAAGIVHVNASDAIGHGYDWAPLAESTIEDKERQGYITPYPLYRTGELKESIGITIGHHVAWVGSDEDKAVWHELGTGRIPARPFLQSAAIESEELIHKLTVETVGHAFAGHSASLIVEGLHAIKEGADFVSEKIDESNERTK